MKTPFIILIAGPNGIGKTSFATWYLQRYRDCSGIIDPDEIARSNVDSMPELLQHSSVPVMPFVPSTGRKEWVLLC